MADTGEKKYDIKEALNRIYRALVGSVVSTDAPGTVPGEILSTDEAISKIAELAENNLAGQTGQVPDGWTVPAAGIAQATTTVAGKVELATNAETITGTDTERAVTPASLQAKQASTTALGLVQKATVAQAEAGTDNDTVVTPEGVLAAINANVAGTTEYGEIYNTSTGTAVVQLSTSWAKITGSFQSNSPFSDHITPDFANDRITITANGIYFVGLFPSFSGGTSAVVNGAAYVDNVRQESVRFRRKLGTGGDVGSAGALGLINITGTPVDLEFWARADTGTPNFKLEAGQLFAFGVVVEV